MHTNTSPIFKYLLPVAATFSILLTTAVAASGEDWKVQLSGTVNEPGSDATTVAAVGPTGALTVQDNTSGFSVSLERQITALFSVELGVSFADYTADVVSSGSNTILTSSDFGTYTLFGGVDWHPGRRADPRPTKGIDWTVGIFVAQGNYDDLVLFRGTPAQNTQRYDDDFGFGLKIGADIPLGSGSWFLNTEVRAVQLLLESEVAGEDIGLDPLTIAVGIGVRL